MAGELATAGLHRCPLLGPLRDPTGASPLATFVVWGSRPTLENQRSIHPAKRKVIVHHILIFHLPKLAAPVVELAAMRVDFVEVEGVGVEGVVCLCS